MLRKWSNSQGARKSALGNRGCSRPGIVGFVCQVCGKRGADIRPDFPQGRMGTAVAGSAMWRMLNAEAVIFMGWNAGTDRRLDRLRTIAAAMAGGLGLEAAHENHRG